PLPGARMPWPAGGLSLGPGGSPASQGFDVWRGRDRTHWGVALWPAPHAYRDLAPPGHRDRGADLGSSRPEPAGHVPGPAAGQPTGSGHAPGTHDRRTWWARRLAGRASARTWQRATVGRARGVE